MSVHAGLEVPEKLGVGWGGFQVTTVSNLNEVDFEVS